MDIEGKWKAILIGGLITGLGPFIPVLNLACCLFPLVGGLVAVSIYRGSQPPPPLSNNDGVVLGALSGVAGAIVYALLLVPLAFFISTTITGFLPGLIELPAGARSVLDGLRWNLGNVVALIVLLKVLGHLALSLIFGIIGGLIGTALCTRKATPTV